MWTAALAALVVLHVTPELEHVRRDALTARVRADELSTARGIDSAAIRVDVARALRAGGIKVHDVEGDAESPFAALTIEIDALQPGAATEAIAFTVRLTIRQSVLLPDRRPSKADIWSRSLVGLAPPATFVGTVRGGIDQLVAAVSEDLGAHHPELEDPPKKSGSRPSGPPTSL
jgi:hypothetical protein